MVACDLILGSLQETIITNSNCRVVMRLANVSLATSTRETQHVSAGYQQYLIVALA